MKMNKLNVSLLLGFILFIFLFFPILFGALHIWDFISVGTMSIFIITKVLVSLALVFVLFLIALGKLNMYFSYLNLLIILILQFLPLVVRAIGCLDYIPAMASYSWIVSLFVSIIWFFATALLFNAYKNQGDRYSKTLKKVQASEHKVVEKETYLDENGDLKGPGNH